MTTSSEWTVDQVVTLLSEDTRTVLAMLHVQPISGVAEYALGNMTLGPFLAMRSAGAIIVPDGHTSGEPVEITDFGRQIIEECYNRVLLRYIVALEICKGDDADSGGSAVREPRRPVPPHLGATERKEPS